VLLGECEGGANMLCSFPYMIGVMLENAFAYKRQLRKEAVEHASRARGPRVELNDIHFQ
jgi:hypothetical protein